MPADFHSCSGALLAALLLVFPAPAPAQLDFAPPHDLFAARADLGSVDTATVSLPVVRASTEYNDPVPDSVWWQWTAPREGWWEVEVPLRTDGLNSALIQVFRGQDLHGLITAPDGGVVTPGLSHRRLFKAEEGMSYQIAASCPLGPGSYLDAVDAAFVLRPAAPAVNTSLTARVPLEPAGPGMWTGQGWANEVAVPPLPLPDGSLLYAPLFWTWTSPVDTVCSVQYGPASSAMYPDIRVFRGTALTQAALITEGGFGAQAGETFTVVAGSSYYASTALAYHQVMIRTGVTGPYVPPNQGSPFPLAGALPLTVSPPAGAPQSGQLWWNWQCPVGGWIAFEGTAGLQPELKGFTDFPPREAPVVFEKKGIFYFWAAAGPYRLVVNGWQWPAGGFFTLRTAVEPPPDNDTFAGAIDLGSAATVTRHGKFLGATRELGDPPGSREIPRPTVWYRWAPPGGGRAEVIASSPWLGHGSTSELRVFTGSGQAWLTEVPVTWRAADEFTPARWEFPVDGVFPECYLCLSGTAEDYGLNARLSGSGTASTETGYVAVTELAGTGVVEGNAVSTGLNSTLRPVWFKWQAPGSGWLSWTTNATSLELSSGPAFNAREDLPVDAEHLPLRVAAGQILWFQCRTGQPGGSAATVFRLRLQFSEAPEEGGTVPGDDPAQPVDLGSQLPLQTRCRLAAATLTPAEKSMAREPMRDRLKGVAWYSWTAPPDVSGCGVSARTAAVDVFAGSPGGERVAFSDTGILTGSIGLSTPPVLGEVLFEPEPGRTYFFMVQSAQDHAATAAVPFELKLYQFIPAPNDSLAGAEVLTSFDLVPSGEDGRRYRLTPETDEPLADPALPGAVHSAWWKWTAPSDGVWSALCLDDRGDSGYQVDGSWSRDFTLAVYTGGPAMADLVRVHGALTGQRVSGYSYSAPPGKRFAFRAVAGRTYLLQAVSGNGSGGISAGIRQGDAYDQWILSTPGIDWSQAGPDANPSGDGLPNLLKFTLGLNPALPVTADPDASRAPAWALSPDGQSLQYTFWSDRFNTGYQLPFPANSSPALANTARLVAEQSADLGYWSRMTEAESLGGNRWRLTLPLNGTQPRRFVRLRAEWVTGPVDGGGVIIPLGGK